MKYDRDCLCDAFADAMNTEARGDNNKPRRGVLFHATGVDPENPACGWSFLDSHGRLEINGDPSRGPDVPALYLPADQIWNAYGDVIVGEDAPWKPLLLAVFAAPESAR